MSEYQTGGRMNAIQMSHDQNDVVTVYCLEFKKKYGCDALLDDQQTMWLIKALKNYRKENTINLIGHYFQMREPEFEREAHSTELFYRSINKINAALARLERNGEKGTRKKGMVHPIDQKLFYRGFYREDGKLFNRNTKVEIEKKQACQVIISIRTELHIAIDGSEDGLVDMNKG